MNVNRVVVFVPVRELPKPFYDVGRKELTRLQKQTFGGARKLVFSRHGSTGERSQRREATVRRRQDELVPTLVYDSDPTVFVVAAQRDDLRGALLREIAHERDDLFRFRTTIDVVAQKHDRVLCVDRGQRTEQLEEVRRLAVHIANHEGAVRHRAIMTEEMVERKSVRGP